jgi:carbon starvation protein CstA
MGWSIAIQAYYFLATILPINAIIGRIYPFFGAIFLFMAVGMAVMLPVGGYDVLPNLDFLSNQHPKGISIWPMLFVTIACGAISGFHATQSPMMVRCLRRPSDLRRVFYGAMVAEGLVALIWCVVGLSLREVIVNGNETLAQLIVQNPSSAVHAAATLLLGSTGGMVAVLGVVVLAVTSGDTAMRSCRLMLADVLRVKQAGIVSRLALALPLFAVVILISQLDFSVIWRYFGWGNQSLACFTLWSVAVCLRRRGRRSIMALLPALFMTCMCSTFLLHAPECAINLPLQVATPIGCAIAAICLFFFARCIRPKVQNA